MIAPMFEDYPSPIDGSPITSRRKRAEDLARNECVEYDPQMRHDYDRRIKEEEKKLDQAVERTVEETILSMPSDKREKLGQELEKGADTEYQRI